MEKACTEHAKLRRTEDPDLGGSRRARTSTAGMLVWKAEDHCLMGLVRMGSSSPTPEGHPWEGVRFRGSTGPDLWTTLPAPGGTRTVPGLPETVPLQLGREADPIPSSPRLFTGPM